MRPDVGSLPLGQGPCSPWLAHVQGHSSMGGHMLRGTRLTLGTRLCLRGTCVHIRMYISGHRPSWHTSGYRASFTAWVHVHGHTGIHSLTLAPSVPGIRSTSSLYVVTPFPHFRTLADPRPPGPKACQSPQ